MILREEDVHGQVLDHLGLVSSVISRLKLIEKIDARIKVSKDNGAKITMGQRVAAMLLNGLGFTDLKHMVLNLATTGAAAFPIWMESHSGNASDKKILQEGASKMQAFCEQLKNAPTFLYVGDSAFYERCVKENVQFKWLSRAPERLKEVKKWVQLPENVFTWQAIGNGYKMTPLLDAVYGDMPQRWLMIYSEKAATRELKTCFAYFMEFKFGLYSSMI